MGDPRADNCRANALDGGMVTGVELVYIPNPDMLFECLKAELIPESMAGGQTIASVTVLDENNLPMVSNVFLCWPWKDYMPGGLKFDFMQGPGNSKIPVEHIITNNYDANLVKGPLAIAVGDMPARTVNSDVIAGLGLPWKRHISFSLIYRKRGGTVVTPPPVVVPPSEPGTSDATLLAILSELKKLNAHLGAG